MREPAPFHAALAEGPSGGHATWFRAADGVRLRAVIWPEGKKGTVLILPGRSESAEKYGRTATELAELGFASVSLDWRGQGLADRLLPVAMQGHVGRFRDYQLDLQALVELVGRLHLPKPLFLLAHSMGGCIAFRALSEGLEVKAAVLTAPMWGIRIQPAIRPFVGALAASARIPKFGQRLAPGTSLECYAATVAFEQNHLTCDADMFAYLQRQVRHVPELGLGGPSLHWAAEALRECRAIRALPAPKVPAVTFLGTREQIVDSKAIHTRMRRWPGSRLDLVEGAQHEILMETRPVRERLLGALNQLFESTT
ncbi:alpha/beta hydrolase [Tabrizicola sp. J26]|uniref:alpha/beta fold hydrolase n=1 Tax=Alitabrizicola rongguiensis TaxID=2909234 RepID=UPI001F26F65D|nr:alpha/beta hydrolase [Tabrizicola rongguiensis]MCF1709001.1 alpha/beta hydrolase [Tabrizicola rongguiensis]